MKRVQPSELELYQRVHIQPYADLRRLDYVQVLTRPRRPQQARRWHRDRSRPEPSCALGSCSLLAVVLEVSAVLQIEHPRRHVDLVPLVVAAVAL